MAVAIATVFTALPTMAATYSSASLSNFKLSLTDLDLEDGIEPTITFGFGPEIFNYSNLGVIAYDPGANSSAGDGRWVFNFSPAELTVTNTSSIASASVSGDSFASQVFQISGNSLGSSNLNQFNYGYNSNIYDLTEYILSANTRLNITVDAFSYIETTIGAVANEQVDSHVYLWTDGFALIENGIFTYTDSDFAGVSLRTDYSDNIDAFKLSDLTLLSVTLDNDTVQNFYGSIRRHLRSSGASDAEITGLTYPGVAAVPVPAALPLMASALGLFGLSRRKNKVASI